MWTLLLVQFLWATVLADNYLAGQNATLNCDAISDSKGLALAKERGGYVWKKQLNNQQVQDVVFLQSQSVEEVFKVKVGNLAGRAVVKPPRLFIRDLKVSDTGTYFCNIMLEPLENSVKTYLDVNSVPIVSAKPIKNSHVDETTGYYEAAICQANEGKPPATLKWINMRTGQIQESIDSTEPSRDGTYNVSSILRLKPGLIGRPTNSTDSVTAKDWTKNFTCVVTHEHFPNDDKEQRQIVEVELLYAPFASISVMGNKLTCNGHGKPRPDITWSRPDGKIEHGRKSIFIDQSNPNKSSGRYFCFAKNSIGRSNVAAIDIQRPKELPTIFTGILRYDASLPLKARDYDMECVAELDGIRSVIEETLFVWTKNGVEIQEELSAYKIFDNITRFSEEKTTVQSTLRIMQVERPRDEGTFKCRLSLPDFYSGYIRVVERRIKVKVDYPPIGGSVKVTVRPRSIVTETGDVRLRCSATSRPTSTFRWFFKGKEISFGPELRLRNVSRDQSGTYKCVASNYVPGSAFAEANITVNYPPGRVVILKTDEGLACYTESGSIPPPIYTWLLPNGTVTTGNKSLLRIPTSDVSTSVSYICLASNNLAESNSTFLLKSSGRVGIGSLSVGEFVVTVIVALLLFTIITIISVWAAKRRDWRGKSVVNKPNKDRSSKPSTLLEYNENPYGGSLASMSAPHNVFDDKRPSGDRNDVSEVKPKKGSIGSIKYSTTDGIPNGEGCVFSPKVDGKPSLLNYATLNSRTSVEHKQVQQDIPSRYKSVEVLDRSGAEVLESGSYGSPRFINKETGSPRVVRSVARNSPLKLSTFSQPPSSLGERPDIIKNYFTTRNPSREKPMQLPLTRALSENFKPVHCSGNVNKDSVQINVSGDDGTREHNSVVEPPTYSRVLAHRRLESPHPVVSASMAEPIFQNIVKNDKVLGYSSDSSSSSSSRRKMSAEQQRTSPASKLVDTPQVKYPSLRHNVVSRDSNSAYPLSDGEFRDSPVPPRCQSVDPCYTSACTPPMAELPIRSYLYQPYTDGSPSQVVPKTNIYVGANVIASPYDSGSDSAKSSNATTVTSSGRKMQSLTLV